MSLLTIAQDVTGRLGLPQPSAVVGSSDSQVKQLLAIINKAGHDLGQAANWQAMTVEFTFTTVAQEIQTAVGAIADLDRFIPNSAFNRTTRRPVNGPLTAAQRQALKAQPQLNTVYLEYWVRQNQYRVIPSPPAGQTIAFEYVSTYWAKSAGGAGQSKFLADTDLTYLDESLLADGAVWMFLRAKGMSYAEEMQTYQRNLEQQIARDGGSTMLSLSPQVIDVHRINLPDGNFGA